MNARLPDCRGLSLIELLIGQVLGLLLLGVMIGTYLGVKRSYLIQDSLARVQENARTALRQITHDLRMAGYRGDVAQAWTLRESAALPLGAIGNECHVGWARAPVVVPGGAIEPVLGGSESAPGAFSGCVPVSNHLAGSDILSLHYFSSYPIDDNDIEMGKVYLRGVATGGLIFRADADRGLPADMTLAGSLRNFRLTAVAYYLRSWSIDAPDTRNPAGDGIPTLVRVTLGDCGSAACVKSEAIVEGIAGLQFKYGVDGDDGLNADEVGDISTPDGKAGWRRVRSVHIGLLARDSRPEPDSAGGQISYRFGDEHVAADAGYRHLWLTDSVALRNPAD